MTEQEKPDLLAAAKDASLVLANVEAVWLEIIALLGHNDDRRFAASCTNAAQKLHDAIEAEEERQPAGIYPQCPTCGGAVDIEHNAACPSIIKCTVCGERWFKQTRTPCDDTQAIDLCDMAALLDNDAHEGGNA